jgi:hypothetical protein
MKALPMCFFSFLPVPLLVLGLATAVTFKTGSGQMISCVETSESVESGKLISCIPASVVSIKSGKEGAAVTIVSCEKGAPLALFDDGTLKSCLLTSDRGFNTGKRKFVNCNRAAPVSLFQNGELKSCSPTSDQLLPAGAGPLRGCGQLRAVSFFQNGDLDTCVLSRDERIVTGGKTEHCQKGQSIKLSADGAMLSCK